MKRTKRSLVARATLVLAIALLIAIIIILVRTAAIGRVTATEPLEYPAPAVDVPAVANNLGTALRFEPISYDEASNAPALEGFRAWLVDTYPRFHAATQRTVVGGGTLIYEWPGTDAALQPIVVMAHQDVVPVAQPERWRHPPFSGVISAGAIWGRGALDCKGQLVGMLEAAESLLAAGHKPARRVIENLGRMVAFYQQLLVGGGGGATLP